MEIEKPDKIYIKYKLQVKKWEKEFKGKYYRIPSKFDIKEAPAKVRYAYKRYFQLKSDALEDSLTEFNLDDEAFVASPEFESNCPFENVSSQKIDDSEDIFDLPSTSQIQQLLQTNASPLPLPSKFNSTSADITHKSDILLESKLNQPIIDEHSKMNKKVKKTLTDDLSKKLFKNSNFSMRNPRKSYSFKSQSKMVNKTVNSENYSDSTSSIIPSNYLNIIPTLDEDYSMCNVKKSDSKSVSTLPNFEKMLSSPKSTPLRQINQSWLQRCTPLGAGGENPDVPVHLIAHTTNSDSFGLKNIVLDQIEPFSNDIETIENSESENDERNLNSSMKPVIKKRKLRRKDCVTDNLQIEEQKSFNDINTIKNDNPEKEKKVLPNIITKSKVHDRNLKKKLTSKIVSPETKAKRKRNKKTIEDSTLHQPDLDDYTPLGSVATVMPRCILEKITLSANPVDALVKASKHIDVNAKSESFHSKLKKTGLTNEDRLQSKIASGTLNDNFVRINIEKKVFVRGKKNMNFSKFKKQQWKDKKKALGEMEFPTGGVNVCFKCGLSGHMARYCTAHRGDGLLPLEATNEDTLLTLKDVEGISNNTNDIAMEQESSTISDSEHISPAIEVENSSQISTPVSTGRSIIPESFLQLLSEPVKNNNTVVDRDLTVLPLCDANELDNMNTDITDALKLFGHTSFRSGQEQAIKRILSGLSTLLILSTGSGKSLCYQLPAYLYSQRYNCITLVISPLVSLMEDQVLSMPDFLKAGCLHTNQTPTQRKKIIELLQEGELNILLISPEALISGERFTGFGSLFKLLPPIAFACIDEVHCVSQWSHNFRPSYLMICRVLREKLKVKCILGLTATATKPTVESIINHLNIPDSWAGVITNPTLPDNLILTVSYDTDKDRSLITLLGSERLENCNSIIVYCIRRDECERIAALIRSLLQEPGQVNMHHEKVNKKRKRTTSFTAEAYHAGMSAAQRRRIQNSFMCGQLKIIVATVAFGMGINKSDIRAVIHYNVPNSFESYVQEVGRSGRDGLPAHCHVFMNRRSEDKDELLKHIHSNSIDRHIIRKLLQKVFVPCKCKQLLAKHGGNERCAGHEVAFGVDDTVTELDIPSENISTLLCYLELHPNKYISVLNNTYVMCKIFSYGNGNIIKAAANTCPPLAMAFALELKKGNEALQSNTLEFNVVDVAAAIGWESGITKYHLKNLEWQKNIDNTSRRSQLKVEFHTLGFRIRAPGDLSPTELDEMLDNLHDRVKTQENTMLHQLEEITTSFSKVASNTVNMCCSLTEVDTYEKISDQLKEMVRDYFQRDNLINTEIELEDRPIDAGRAIMDIRSIISTYRDCKFTGRAIARILQGISSPNFPALVWGRCRFWRSHLNESFHGLARLATQQIMDMCSK